MPLGFSAAISCAGVSKRRMLRIDVALAHAPRDDLRVLRPEIEDDDLFVHRLMIGERGQLCLSILLQSDEWKSLKEIQIVSAVRK